MLPDEYKTYVNQSIGWWEFVRLFSNNDECLLLYFYLKYDGYNCVKCSRSVVLNYNRVKNENAFRCKSCHTVIHPLSGSVFAYSHVPISHIFNIIFTVSCMRGSTSAVAASARFGMTEKTAHRLMMIVRGLLHEHKEDKMSGVVEIDEAFLGKGSKLYNWSSISTRKQPIIGFVERKTKKVRLFLVKNRSAKTIQRLVFDNVAVGSTVYTDSWRGYTCLGEYYNHQSVDHSAREYVRDDVHTNTIENVWCHLKRNIRGAHIKISDKYVQHYINEACWRHNNKGVPTMKLFDKILKRSFFADFYITGGDK